MSDEQSAMEPPSTGADVETDDRKPGAFKRWLKGLRNGRNGGSALRETFEELIEEHEERDHPIDFREKQLLHKILAFGNLTVDDVMVPRADIVAAERGTSLDEVIAIMAQEAHSRVPVYRDTLDDVIGMIHIKDVLPLAARKESVQLTKLVREVLFVTPSMRVLDLMLQMRMSRTHMALVVDEYGGVDGLVTIEDAVEQIVGEIEDEHDETQRPSFEMRRDGTVIADARVPIEEFEVQVGTVLTPEERENDIETLGGLVFSVAGRVPIRGEVLRHEASGIEFEVVDADPRRIRRLRLCNLPVRPDADG